MSANKRLFVGCGDGRELLTMATHPDVTLVGIEPIRELYRLAINNLLAFPKIKLLNCRVQDLRIPADGIGFDRIYMIFPAPRVLEVEAKEISLKIKELLSREKGVLELYSEVDLEDWPDKKDCRRLEYFLDSLRQIGLDVVIKTVDYGELPEFVKGSGCSKRLWEHGITKYTFVEAIKNEG